MKGKKTDKRRDVDINRRKTRWILVLSMGLLVLLTTNRISFADEAEIWDNDISDWTTTFANGDPIDTGTTPEAEEQQLAIDANDVVYVAYEGTDGAQDHIYLSRYDGTDVRIWDNDTSDWTTTLADGDPIDTGTANQAGEPQLAIDANNVVYVAYLQSDGAQNHIYLSRYDGTDVRIWDNDISGWTTTFANGDPIDTGTANDAEDSPQLAIDANNIVYVTYYQSDGAQNHIYLSRYDGTDVRIWDNDTSGWTTTFANGDPIDTGTANDAEVPQLAIDANDVVYVTYEVFDGAQDHIHLSRYDGTDVRIWDNDTSGWTTIFANGDPIDTGTANGADGPQLAIDANNVVYVAYAQTDGAQGHIYLSRYDGTDVRIWDNDTSGWTTTFANGDPIGTGTADGAGEAQLAIDANNIVYVAYEETVGVLDQIYLSRYDGTDVRIWDHDMSGWTATLANGDPIDTDTANDSDIPQLAIDANNVVYVTYEESNGALEHIYLCRYDGTDVRIWDNDTSGWTTTFANGDPINTGTTDNTDSPQIAIDANDIVYVTYGEEIGAEVHVYLSRYLDSAALAGGAVPAGVVPGGGGGGGGGAGCFIATAANSSLMKPMASMLFFISCLTGLFWFRYRNSR